ncbi:uncharacterized protein HKW66_Vig0145560 [Vigna angularis]|uniref:Uncharacterized protein n=1 Tax=Phaseolus angularis TaxID=3914 RepID=A0A8T0KCR1_PHAAN|nr:uncharacterized protein HKW66_Vig0145560 [Vigna angularis]
MHCGSAFESATDFFSVFSVNFFTGLRSSTTGRTLLLSRTITGHASGSATSKFVDQTLGRPDIANPTLKNHSSRTQSQVGSVKKVDEMVPWWVLFLVVCFLVGLEEDGGSDKVDSGRLWINDVDGCGLTMLMVV